MQAAQIEQEDKRAAEDEIARREDKKFAQTMQEASRDFQAKQTQLDRDQQNAIISGNREAKNNIEKRREALRRFNIELNMDAAERNTNAMLSMIKGGLKQEAAKEKAKTVLEDEANQFDKDKDIYNKTKDKIVDAIDFDKRMDLPVPETLEEKIPSKWDVVKNVLVKGPALEAYSQIQHFRKLKKETKNGLADPMSVLQDQIMKYGGNISVEELDPDKIKDVETRIQEGKIKTEDINKTLAALEGMSIAIDKKRKAVDKDSKERSEERRVGKECRSRWSPYH